MPSIGIDRNTGKVLTGLDHVRQSVGVIFTTYFGERVEREEFGSDVPPLLGRDNFTAAEQLRFFAAIHVALALWEPRLKSLRVSYLTTDNTVAGIRQGKPTLRIQTTYYPNALQGDFTSDVITVDL